MIMAHTNGLIYKNRNDKFIRLPRVVQMIISAVVTFVGVVIIKLFLANVFGV